MFRQGQLRKRDREGQGEEDSDIRNSFLHLLMQQLFFEHFLYARHCLHSTEQDKEGIYPQRNHSPVGVDRS